MHKERIHNMLEKIVAHTEAEVGKGLEYCDTQELGEAIDMIKDLCEAEMLCEKKCYYKSIVEAMEEEEAEMRAGYDRWRTSTGRFAPKGHGHETSMAMATGRAGYDHRLPNPHYDDPRLWTEPWASRAGYVDGTGGHIDGSDGTWTHGGSEESTHAGAANDARSKYHEAKRHYHESRSNEDKMRMDEKAEEYLCESIETMKDIFVQSDPRMQQKMKDDLAKLFREMGGK